MRTKILLLIAALLLLGGVAHGAEPCITHEFVSELTPGGDPDLVSKTAWNACHVEPPKSIMFSFGCTKTACPVLEDEDDYPSIVYNHSERTWTITEVLCKSNAGNPTIQLQRDDGSPTNMFSSALTCDPTPSGTDGSDGILTSFVSGENVISPTHWIDFLIVAAGGTAKQVSISIKYTVNP